MFLFNLIWLFIFCTCLAARDPPKVTLPDQGIIVGKEVSRSRVQKIIGYYGIPYAQPPVDQLRFSPPLYNNLTTWDDVRNATKYKPACLQDKRDIRDEALPFLGLISNDDDFEKDEDCLYLNVFVPYGSPAFGGFATIIWFHPGNYTTGRASMWNPHTLVYRHRVIVVTLNWRLGIMGFFSSMDGEASGNYGLMDQQAAMVWVKKNINHFGGNPNNICLMGYGTGGVSIGLHMTNHKSRDLFHKAIIMSANFLNPTNIKGPEEDKKFLDYIAKIFGCERTPTSRLIECLRVADGETLVEVAYNVNWRPIIDAEISNSSEPFLFDYPNAHLQNGDFYKVPLLTGYTNMEEILLYSNLNVENLPKNASNEELQQHLTDIINSDVPNADSNNDSCIYNYNHMSDAIEFFYGPTTNIQSPEELRKIVASFTTEKNYGSSMYLQASYFSTEQPTYVYRFDMKPVTYWAVQDIPDWVAVPHLFDLIYVWGIPYWSEQDGSPWDLRDKRISDIIMSFWTNFAKSSNPTEGTLYPINWEQFTQEKPGILLIDNVFNMSNDKNFNYKAFEFWNEYYPKVVKVATQCCTGAAVSLSNNIYLFQILIGTSLYLMYLM